VLCVTAKWPANAPHPRIGAADDGLAAAMDVNMLHRDLLSALAAVPVQSFEQRRVCPARPAPGQRLERKTNGRVSVSQRHAVDLRYRCKFTVSDLVGLPLVGLP